VTFGYDAGDRAGNQLRTATIHRAAVPAAGDLPGCDVGVAQLTTPYTRSDTGLALDRPHAPVQGVVLSEAVVAWIERAIWDLRTVHSATFVREV
jgi:hypothetical protein